MAFPPLATQRRRPAIAAAVALAATLCTVALQAAPLAGGDEDTFRKELLAAVAQRRADLGLGPLAVAESLQRAAQQQAEEMASLGWFGFTSPAGVTTDSRVEAAGFRADLVAAKVYRAPREDTATALAERWWKETGASRQSVFHGGVDTVGLGIATTDSERFFVFLLAGSAPQGPPPSLGSDAADRRAQFLAAANEVRAAHHLPALVADARLDEAAQTHAEGVLAALRAGRSLEGLPNLATLVSEGKHAPTILAAGGTGGSAFIGARTPAKGGNKIRGGAIGQTVVVDALSAADAVATSAREAAPDLLAAGYAHLGVGMAYVGDGPAPHVVWVACLTRHDLTGP